MKTQKLEIGQTLFFVPIGNAARGGKAGQIFEATVATIGNKFFTVKCDGMRDGRFHIGSLLHDGGQYSSNYQGYLSKQAILDEKEQLKLIEEIRRVVGTYGKTNLSFDQCKAISAIIKGEDDINGLLLAVEFGYKRCEKGENLDKALIDYRTLRNI